jgi:glycosyltransferase involved in cell wall biosynthesis
MIDRNAPVDALRQLGQLVRPTDRIVSVGPVPDYPLPVAVEEWHEPMGSAWACGMWNAPNAKDMDLVHVWSTRAQRAAEVIAPTVGEGALIRTLPSVPPGGKPLRRLVRSLRAENLVVLVPTIAARDALLAQGLDANRVSLLPTGAAPTTHLAERRERLRTELGLPDNAFLIVAPDQLVRPANHNYAAWAHAIMRYVLDEPSFLLVPASGPMDRAFKTFARGAGFIDRTFVGLDPEQYTDALAAADVAVFFRRSDCGSSSLTAAMAAGCPIVAFDTPDVVETLADAAIYTQARTPRAAGQALLRLREEAGLAEQLSQQATSRAERFTPDLAQAAMDALYTQLAPSTVAPMGAREV